MRKSLNSMRKYQSSTTFVRQRNLQDCISIKITFSNPPQLGRVNSLLPFLSFSRTFKDRKYLFQRHKEKQLQSQLHAPRTIFQESSMHSLIVRKSEPASRWEERSHFFISYRLVEPSRTGSICFKSIKDKQFHSQLHASK